jgi:uncharacterized protein YcaQ
MSIDTPPINLRTARHLLLAVQGLLHPPTHPADQDAVLAGIRRMGILQIDTINIVARSPYLVLFSRLGAYEMRWLDDLLASGALFEYWAHAACFIPIEDYPLYRSRMELLDRKQYSPEWRERNAAVIQKVIDAVHGNGPVRSSDFERTDGQKGSWWNWKEEKRILEYLHTSGELMIARRDKFQRVYDLRQRVLPDWDDSQALPLEEASDLLTERAVRHLGAAPARWVHDYFRLPKLGMAQRLERLADAGRLVRLTMQHSPDPWYLHPENLSLLEWALGSEITPTYTTLLSPFDPLIWDRERTRVLFDFDYSIECYLPESKRRYGYFSLPILHEGALVGRLDAKAHRKEGQFEVRAIYTEPAVSLNPDLLAAVAAAIQRCAAWHKTPEVVFRKSEPERLAPDLAAYF